MRSLSVILESTTDDGDMLDIFYRPSSAPKTFSRKLAQNTHSQGALGQAPRLCKGRNGEHYRWLTHPLAASYRRCTRRRYFYPTAPALHSSLVH